MNITRLVTILLIVSGWGVAQATNILTANFNSTTNRLSLVVAFEGQTPHHNFSLAFGDCVKSDEDERLLAATAQLIDAQGEELAETTFQQTVEFNFANYSCRPGILYIRTGRSFAQVSIP